MIRTWFAVVIGLAVTTGCGYSSRYMAKLEVPQPIQPDPASATVVVLRPSGYASGLKTAILDTQSGFLGESAAKTYFVAHLAPGNHTLVAWSEGTPALNATVEAGKVYYVEVGMVIGFWSGHARLFGIGPQREQWPKLSSWLHDSDMLVLQPGAPQMFMQDHDNMREIIQKGVDNFAGYDAEARAKRSLIPPDGVPGPVP
jgi:hypothetical protein